jgi:hypothetical protein
MGASGPFRQVAPDQLQVREGGGCLSLFGLPFLAAGILVTLIGARVVPVQNARQVSPSAWPLILLMGLVFVAVGGGLVLGRRWTSLDAGRGVIRKQWGLLVPLRGEEYPLHDYEAVLLRFDAGDSDTADRYPVLLRARAGGADLPLSSTTQYGESRGQAAAVAKLLAFPLVDASTHHESVTRADRVDATLQDRLRTGDDRHEEAIRPLRMQSQVRESGRAVEIVIPGPGFRRRTLISFAISIGLLAYVAPDLLRFFRQTSTPEAVQFVFFGVAVLLFLVIPLVSVINAAAMAMRGRTLVTASAEGITIEERGAWRSKTTRIPAADILGLDFDMAEAALTSAWREADRLLSQAGRTLPSPRWGGAEPRWLSRVRRLVRSKGVIVKSRRGLIPFGAGLPDEEVRYLRALVGRALGGADGRRW